MERLYGEDYVFIESSCMMARGRKIITGSQAQNSGMNRPKTLSAAVSLQMKFTARQAPVIVKLSRMADFMVFGSRQTRTGRDIMSIIILMMGSVIRKYFWL